MNLFSSQQMTFFDVDKTNDQSSSTFLDNLSLPIHRWFRFSAGFSARWVTKLIEREKKNGRYRILDPFSGSGTVLLQSELSGVESIGIEAHPFVFRVARAKLFWREDPQSFYDYAQSILDMARSLRGISYDAPPLLNKSFPPEVLQKLISLRTAWEMKADASPVSELTWLALVSIVRESSPVGTAQWQYVLPKKKKANPVDPYDAFARKIKLMSEDMRYRQAYDFGPKPFLHRGDARECRNVPDGWADLVITSPPYPNNYDYADATRLELTFMGEIRGWGDLQDAVRKYLVRSCTQHVARLDGDALLCDPLLDPIKQEIRAVYEKLKEERKQHGGKKPYHNMVVAYFYDMAKMWHALRRVTATDSLVCFVVGDSAPYGVYVPVDRWLGELAVAAGFKSYLFEKTRDRNIKWKNRKHRVPLHEGRLWIKG